MTNRAQATFYQPHGGSLPPTALSPQPAHLVQPSPKEPQAVASTNSYATIPDGWATAVDPSDGRMYYYEKITGQTSWRHPNAPPEPPPRNEDMTSSTTTTKSTSRSQNNAAAQDYVLAPSDPVVEDNPLHATKRPDNHQCHAFTGLIMFPPVGIIAMYHSIQIDRCWNQGKYSESVSHARQAPQFSTLSIWLGVFFWIYWFFFRADGGGWEWPDWDFNFGD